MDVSSFSLSGSFISYILVSASKHPNSLSGNEFFDILLSKGEQVMIDTVIFDFDGLLVDTEIIAYEIYHQILDKHGFVFTK